MASRLAIFDLRTGRTETVLITDRLIEAPNWHPEDDTLVINGEGRLFRVPLEKPALVKIDTGFATRLNNDHGISPDGMSLVISDATQTDGSCIYTLPFAGGVPCRVTPLTPSWWHGWSPDGATLAYTARRDGVFDIYTCPVTGGAERKLTVGFQHTDGPDYTPDGAWIWFNGERRGRMDLWRMQPDGADLQQMTDDAGENWFAHPSPDGAHVLFVAYGAGTAGHPRDLPVELRIMPANGGASHSLYALTGGQGTINVPCWSPCSTRFAFVETVPDTDTR